MVRLLIGGSEEIGDFPWVGPSPQELEQDRYALFRSLFDPDRHGQRIQEPWRLRLRPEKLGPGLGIPPAPWSWLGHPVMRCHLQDCGWTVAEERLPLGGGTLSGEVRVMGSEDLVQDLRRRLGPRVKRWEEERAPDPVVIVQGGLEGREGARRLREIQERALRQEVPILLWTHRQRPPAAGMVQISPTGQDPIEPGWIAQFYRHLMLGDDPDLAFARADLHGSASGQQQRWMVGVFREWRAPAHSPRVPHDWFYKLDRSVQEKQLRECIEALFSEGTARRIHVVLSSGPENSGLDLFRRRTVSLRPERIPVVEQDLAWAEQPAHQEAVLMHAVRARSRAELASAWSRLRSPEDRRSPLFLLVIGHETAFLDGGPPTRRRVGVTELRSYFAALEQIATRMASSDVRVLVHLSFEGGEETHRALRELKRTGDRVMVKVLPPLGAVGHDELESWVESHNLTVSPGEIEAFGEMSYDQLVQWISTRFPEDL